MAPVVRIKSEQTAAPTPRTRRNRLVDDVMAFIRKYVVLSSEQCRVTALWVVHTHCVQYVEQTPYLAVTSPEKRCGKSRLLETVELLSARPWNVVLPSEAVVYRKVDLDMPTLLLDEVDAIFNPKTADKYEGLRALLNNGNRRGAMVPRCIGQSADIAEFSTFCPKLLAGIGTLPDTVADRSIPIRLERKTRKDVTAPFKRREVQPDADALRQRLERWAKQHAASLADATPDMPEQLNDRMQDGCESLVAIGDMLGCGQDARAALVALLSVERLDDQDSMRIRLLRDLRAVFDKRDALKLSTKTILAELISIDDAPWSTYYGRTLEARDLSSLLRHYKVAPTTVRLKDDRIVKGYKRDDLHAAWERYL
jgi:Protein of unknown function (DUF3631)